MDVLSRSLRVEPMQSLTSVATGIALVSMLNKSVASEGHTGYQPSKIRTEQGRDFEGEFRKFCNDVGIHQYHTFSKTKTAFAERNIRSLKAKIVRYPKKSGWGVTLTVVKTLCKQSTKEQIAQLKWLQPV